ncbi:unnamed protein product [Lactuca saligna]|uniref:RRM domain-containing protein n=1 Tax=Lactuca saligna TaxID=75948 RepID=A0AA35YAU2_LACSI|nr:unnamed protein product [Lactuca saligna]
MNSENSRWKSDDVWNKDFHFNGVDKRNRFQSKRDQYHLRYDSQSFYITNFPKTILPSDLWCDCGCLGKIVEVFISNKKSRMGKRFGFVRFFGKRSRQGNKELDNVAMGNKEPVNVAIVLNSGDFIIRNKKLAYLAKARDFLPYRILGCYVMMKVLWIFKFDMRGAFG